MPVNSAGSTRRQVMSPPASGDCPVGLRCIWAQSVGSVRARVKPARSGSEEPPFLAGIGAFYPVARGVEQADALGENRRRRLHAGDEALTETVDDVDAASAPVGIEHRDGEAQRRSGRVGLPAPLDIQVERGDGQRAGRQHVRLFEVGSIRLVLQLRAGDDVAALADPEDFLAALIEEAHLVVEGFLAADEDGAPDRCLQRLVLARFEVGAETIAIRQQPQIIHHGPQLAAQELRQEIHPDAFQIRLPPADLPGLALV